MNLRVLLILLRYGLDAHRSNPANLIAGAAGMIINNVLLFIGMWGMLFAGKSQNLPLLPYYIVLNSIVLVSFGGVNFFLGGLRSLGELISEGALEPMLATPRNPLLLVSGSRSHPVALGDLIMGILGFVALAFVMSPGVGFRCVLAAIISAIAFAALFVLAGSLSFFIPRGNNVGYLLTEMMLSLSIYPTGKLFSGTGRVILLLTPAAATAVLPVEAVERATFGAFALALLAATALSTLALFSFRIGLKRYRSVSLIGPSGI